MAFEVVECGSIESAEGPFVLWKVGRDPVDDHADAVTVKNIDEVATAWIAANEPTWSAWAK